MSNIIDISTYVKYKNDPFYLERIVFDKDRIVRINDESYIRFKGITIFGHKNDPFYIKDTQRWPVEQKVKFFRKSFGIDIKDCSDMPNNKYSQYYKISNEDLAWLILQCPWFKITKLKHSIQ